MKLYRPVAAEFKITSPYGSRIDPVTGAESEFHGGIDFGVPVGTPVVAGADGQIVKAGWENPDNPKQGFGHRVWQAVNGTNAYIVYGHLSELAVKEGDVITAGTRIGLSGSTGKSTGPHLHYEVREGGISGVKGSPIELI